MPKQDDIIDYIVFRDFVVEEKIKEVLDAAATHADSVTIDRGDLSDEEVEYLRREVKRRLCGL